VPPPVKDAAAFAGTYFEGIERRDVADRVNAMGTFYSHQVERAFSTPYLLYKILQQLGRLEQVGSTIITELRASRQLSAQTVELARIDARNGQHLAEGFGELVAVLEGMGGDYEDAPLGHPPGPSNRREVEPGPAPSGLGLGQTPVGMDHEPPGAEDDGDYDPDKVQFVDGAGNPVELHGGGGQ
jgi:hypothetical protein